MDEQDQGIRGAERLKLLVKHLAGDGEILVGQVSRRLGIDTSYLSRILANKRRSIGMATMRQVSNTLPIALEFFTRETLDRPVQDYIGEREVRPRRVHENGLPLRSDEPLLDKLAWPDVSHLARVAEGYADFHIDGTNPQAMKDAAEIILSHPLVVAARAVEELSQDKDTTEEEFDRAALRLGILILRADRFARSEQ